MSRCCSDCTRNPASPCPCACHRIKFYVEYERLQWTVIFTTALREQRRTIEAAAAIADSVLVEWRNRWLSPATDIDVELLSNRELWWEMANIFIGRGVEELAAGELADKCLLEISARTL